MSTQYNTKLWWDEGRGAYILSTPYSNEFVEALKKLIPYSERIWYDRHSTGPYRGVWVISESAGEQVFGLMKLVWGEQNVTFISKDDFRRHFNRNGAGPAPNQTTTVSRFMSVDDAFKQFCSILSFEAMRAAYIKSCTVLHPDRDSGDADKMTILNSLWDKIKKEKYGQS